ncbi:hypothetical protein IWX90DRAFT_76952 [Phyllosticta citrichinensis]|uniref:Uncharacterized protein n=1 Tax=Phyllosticta citrichinensis TaxID=1130410 RepID=A0ABR1XGM9_9PEZI
MARFVLILSLMIGKNHADEILRNWVPPPKFKDVAPAKQVDKKEEEEKKPTWTEFKLLYSDTTRMRTRMAPTNSLESSTTTSRTIRAPMATAATEIQPSLTARRKSRAWRRAVSRKEYSAWRSEPQEHRFNEVFNGWWNFQVVPRGDGASASHARCVEVLECSSGFHRSSFCGRCECSLSLDVEGHRMLLDCNTLSSMNAPCGPNGRVDYHRLS